MKNIGAVLGSAVSRLSDQNYTQSLAYCRLWLELEQTYCENTPDLLFNAIQNNRKEGSMSKDLTYPVAPLILRFTNDLESHPPIASHYSGLQRRLCSEILRCFLDIDLEIVHTPYDVGNRFYIDANFVANCVNLGYMEEVAIRNHILQPLISHGRLYHHQVYALYILFKIAGATFNAYANTAVVDRCFELLKSHNHRNEEQRKMVEEVIQLREHGWEGLPLPPAFATGKTERSGVRREGPGTTPVATSLGLPNTDFEPPIPEPVTAPVTEILPASESANQSPSVSVVTLSDFTNADVSDDESPTDPSTTTLHNTFYLEDGNVEVLCGNTLFRVHTSILSFHSPALRQMFAQASLATAESPSSCPRIVSTDSSMDFTTLLKMIYLPGFPERNKVPTFDTFSSLLRIASKYEMPTVRSQLLEVIHDAYPETFERVTPTRTLGERVFSGSTPHPNEVLNLFVQQGLAFALPMAYYMAARRGVSSLMDRRLPQSATLPPEILQSAINGFVALRELELNETHRLVLRTRTSAPCSSLGCTLSGPRIFDGHQKVVDRITGPSRSGTKVLQILSLGEGDFDGFCENCVKGWEDGHIGVRKKAWDMLPTVFGLRD